MNRQTDRNSEGDCLVSRHASSCRQPDTVYDKKKKLQKIVIESFFCCSTYCNERHLQLCSWLIVAKLLTKHKKILGSVFNCFGKIPPCHFNVILMSKIESDRRWFVKITDSIHCTFTICSFYHFLFEIKTVNKPNLMNNTVFN